jgi:hypothetical protein
VAYSQFDLSNMLRCPATDDEGYRCGLRPNHDGPHRWDRCPATDPEGHRCWLPPNHPGGHELPWYDRPARPGETHTISYGGTDRETNALAQTTSGVADRYGWVLRSRSFTPAPAWRTVLSRWLGGPDSPSGRLSLVFEYRGDEVDTPEGSA